MSKFIKDFKTLVGFDTIIALALCSVMWLLYYFTDYKFSREFESDDVYGSYINKVIIGISMFISLGGAFYFVNKLAYSMIETVPRLVLIALFVGIGGFALYTVGAAVPKNFLQSDVALLSIFSGMSLFLLLVFGWREPDEVKNAIVAGDKSEVPVETNKAPEIVA